MRELSTQTSDTPLPEVTSYQTGLGDTLGHIRVLMTQSARSKKIGLGQVVHVITHCQPTVGKRDTGETELSWVGLDDRGLELEVIGIPDAKDRYGNPVLLIIHAMPTSFRRN